jgi:hypothetical protein
MHMHTPTRTSSANCFSITRINVATCDSSAVGPGSSVTSVLAGGATSVLAGDCADGHFRRNALRRNACDDPMDFGVERIEVLQTSKTTSKLTSKTTKQIHKQTNRQNNKTNTQTIEC